MEMKMQILILISFLFNGVLLCDSEEDIDEIQSDSTNIEFEPISNSKYNEKISIANIDCDNFTSYATKCRLNAALIYNSSRMSPPTPLKINDWCKAIKHLTNCAIDWNSDCKDVTESHFNRESTKGHIHIINNICDNDWFLVQYGDISSCIDNTTDDWEYCYVTFQNIIEKQINTSYEWTHYENHFLLCCARARFRRCTLESLFASTSQCTREQAMILQKFSIIVSEGAVFQDCDRNMMYENCPGGDPRPTDDMLQQLVSGETYDSAPTKRFCFWFIFILLQ